MVPARRDGGKNKDCSELHDAIFAPIAPCRDHNRSATSKMRISKQLLRRGLARNVLKMLIYSL
ncbi:MAG: hypothetical protein BECKG1743D_GA0114223_102544 [Candidatus Kentron sp. G]|nr:MAG: hypothetical protein BECKG1743D_GA0114223_102544 [Candidatus Kentron sp. G]